MPFLFLLLLTFSKCDNLNASIGTHPPTLKITKLPSTALNPIDVLNSKEAYGPSGSGGGNLLLTKILVAWSSLKTLAASASLDILEDIELKVNRPHQLYFLTQGKDSNIHFQSSQFETLNEYESLLKLANLVASTNPDKARTQTQLAKQLTSVVQQYIKYPQLIGLDQLQFQEANTPSDAKQPDLSSCRDQLRVSGNPRTGRILLNFSSTGTCLPNLELNHLEFVYNNFHREYLCENDGENLICKDAFAATDNFDSSSCALIKLNNPQIKDPPGSIAISADHRIQISHQWCHQEKAKTTIFQLKRTYQKVAQRIEPRINQENRAKATKADLNGISKSLAYARSILTQSLDYAVANSSSEEVQNLGFQKPELELMHEVLSKAQIQVDLSSDSPFSHMGYGTWIESHNRSIRIRPLSYLNYLNRLNVSDYIYWLAHELAHIVFHERGQAFEPWIEEQQVIRLGLNILSFTQNRFQNSPFFQINLTPQTSFVTGCRDTIEVEDFNIVTSHLKVKVSTSREQCRKHNGGLLSFLNQFKFTPEEITFDMNCRLVNDGFICRNTNPQIEMSICPIYNQEFQKDDKEVSSLFIDFQGAIRAEYYWCINEESHRTTFGYLKQSYQKLDRMEQLPPSQVGPLKRLNNGFGGGLLHYFRGKN